MTILKSFFKQSKVKIYLILLISIFLLLLFSQDFKNMYVNKVNSYYEKYNTYIEFSSSRNDYQDIANVSNIDEVIMGANLKASASYVTNADFFPDSTLKENEVKINRMTFDNIKIGDIVSIDGNDFTIVDIGYYDNYESYMNYEMLQEYIQNKGTSIYKLKLKDWSKIERTLTNLQKARVYSKAIINDPYMWLPHFNFIDTFRTIGIVAIIISAIVIFYIIASIFYYENEKNFIFSNMGYSKMKRRKIIFMKLGSLFILALLISIILSTLIRIFIKVL